MACESLLSALVETNLGARQGEEVWLPYLITIAV